MDRSSEVKALIEAVVANIRDARVVDKPFHHLEFDRVFPDDVYARMVSAMPNAADYRPLPGRNRGNIREDGSSTRVKIDLFPEYIRHLTDEKRAIWDLVGRALCSSEVQAAFMRGLAPGLERRFGSDFANVGMYPIPVLTRDIPGYRITPHTDTQWKGITVQLYLPRDASATHIGTIFHERLPDGSLPKAMQMRFAPNTGYAFAVGDDTWHSADPVGTEVETPGQHPAHLFRRCRPVADPAQPRQADRQFPPERGQARGAKVTRAAVSPLSVSLLEQPAGLAHITGKPDGGVHETDLRRVGAPQGPRKVATTGL